MNANILQRSLCGRLQENQDGVSDGKTSFYTLKFTKI